MPVLPDEAYNYANLNLPDHISQLLDVFPMPDSNPVSDAGATLGRVLFYDRNLSANGLVACSTCHTQATGFDDPLPFSIGFTGRITKRSAMRLTNARFNMSGRQFWDERSPSLEDQVLQPFTDPIEMGLKDGELVRRVQDRDWYQPLFENAFGDGQINEDRIAQALAQFVRSLVSYTSRYDHERAKAADPLEPFTGFSEVENEGKHLFFTEPEAGGAGCASCHMTEAFVMLGPDNNGLEIGDDRRDNAPDGSGVFRSPSLKNVALSPPYMHDGRIKSLGSVIDHYADSVSLNPDLSPLLIDGNGKPTRLELNTAQRGALVAFLETLTDEGLISDPRFSDPFSR